MQLYLLSEKLDIFCFKTLQVEKFNSLSLIVQIVLVLHNDEAEIEHRFSINKEIMKDNISEMMTLVSSKIVRDYLKVSCLET